MAQINITRLATSDRIDLCKGFFLFGSGVRAGIAPSKVVDKPLFNKSKKVAAWKLVFRSQAGMEFGLCGPAYATLFDVSGSTTGNQLDLTVANNASEAGMVCALGVNASISLELFEYRVKFKKGKLKGKWSNALRANLNFSIDALSIIIGLIRSYFSSGDDGAENADDDFGDITGFKFRARTGGNFGGSGTIFMRPAYTQLFDLSNLYPGLKSFKDTLKKAGGGFSFGPLFGFAIPVVVEPTSIVLKQGGSEAEYTKLSGNSSLAINGVIKGQTSDTPLAAPETIKVTLKHTPGFDLITGFGMNLSLFKVFSFGISIEISLGDLLGFSVTLDSKFNSLSNDIGSRQVSAREADSEIRVVFEPPVFDPA